MFESIAQKIGTSSNTIIEDLDKILCNIQDSTMGGESHDDFRDLFEDLDLASTKLGQSVAEKNSIISKIIIHLNDINFRFFDAESDVLGDAYEYLIGKFANDSGRQAGEFYTPQPVSKVIARVVSSGKSDLRSVYDPTCGSGSLLLRVAREVKRVGKFVGQESNRTTYNLARMNMILHGVNYKEFSIALGNTLERPMHLGKKFEAIVANPPFGSNWSVDDGPSADPRFSDYGSIAPRKYADLAFVQHMLYHLAESGVMVVVLSLGVLTRVGAEEKIRKHIVSRNWLDAVVVLPKNMFYGTPIAACILVFKKRRQHKKVLFVDASKNFKKGESKNFLSDEDVDRIVHTYRDRAEIAYYSRSVDISKIEENDFKLNVLHYIDKPDAERIDLGQVVSRIRRIDQEMPKVDSKIRKFCKSLGIKSPV